MIKRITAKGIELDIKTNILKDGICYFGGKDNLTEILDATVKKVRYNNTSATPELFLIALDIDLKTQGIKASRIKMGPLIFEGTRMTQFGKKETQETLHLD